MDFNIGFSATTQLAASATQDAREEQKAAAKRQLKAQVQLVAEASATDVAGIFAEMVQRGAIVLGIEVPEDEPEVDSPEEAAALDDAVASEFDWTDEDAEPIEHERPQPRQTYVIRVCQDEKGKIACVPPYSDWSGAVGRTAIGRKALANHNNRLRTYRLLGDYLAAKYPKQLREGPAALNLDLRQDVFARDVLARAKIDKSQLSRFLNYCELVWDDDLMPDGASLPVRNLFRAK